MSAPAPHSRRLVDTHAHLDDQRLRTDLDGVLDRASRAGVTQIIAIGTTAATSAGVVELAQAHRGVFASGRDPSQRRGRSRPRRLAPASLDLVAQPGVVAVGETGLDRYWDRTPFEQQQEWFDRHLNLAREHDLPVVIHCRDCQRDIIEQLRELGRPVQGVMHAFTGTWDDAQAFLDLGLHLSFAGMVTFTNKGLDCAAGRGRPCSCSTGSWSKRTALI